MVQKMFRKGIEKHIAGQLTVAKKFYTFVLDVKPDHPDANHNMGLLKLDMGHCLDALPYFQTAIQANMGILQFWLSYGYALIRSNRSDEALRLIDLAKEYGFTAIELQDFYRQQDKQRKNLTDHASLSDNENKALDKNTSYKPLTPSKQQLDKKSSKNAAILCNKTSNELSKTENTRQRSETSHSPPADKINRLIYLYKQGKYKSVLELAEQILSQYPSAPKVWNLMGFAALASGAFEKGIRAFKKVTILTPDNPYAHYNFASSLKKQGKLNEAISAFKTALFLKPDHYNSYNNLGNVFRELGQFDEALANFRTAATFTSDNALIHKNIAEVLKLRNEFEAAIKAYDKVLALEPDNTDIYINIAAIRREQGKINLAIAAYKKAITIEIDNALAHRNLSTLVKYAPSDPQIRIVGEFLKRTDLSDNDLCQFHFTFAKMHQDLGNFDLALENYVAGGNVRQKLLSYDFQNDENLFKKIKENSTNVKNCPSIGDNKAYDLTPIFILGMPRSGTSLIENIISSHTQVHGAGELNLVDKFGLDLSTGTQVVTPHKIAAFRNDYMSQLYKLAENKKYVADKMPHNFLHTGLILRAIPEAKIVHVKRDPAATCWSNFKHYFPISGLGYCYGLESTVEYYKMYQELMKLWTKLYPDQIYDLSYDELTEKQEIETRKLLKYLGLEWQISCMSPQDNKRVVKTASMQQVKKPVYRGSSESWRKFEQNLGGVFDRLYD